MTRQKMTRKKDVCVKRAISHSEQCQDSKLSKVPRIPCIYPWKGADQKADERQG